MAALLVNIFVNSKENFEDFQVTIKDLDGVFTHSYVMFRGRFANDCIDFLKKKFSGDVLDYQYLNDTDWIKNTLKMAKDIKQKSVFIYLEDHRLVANRNQLKTVLNDFETCSIDYMSYSFFDSGSLESNNLLPLNPEYYKDFDVFDLTLENQTLLNKISPNYFIFSMPSVVSVDYLKHILIDANSKKLYSKYFSIFLSIFLPYPKYRNFISHVNNLLKVIKLSCNFYPVKTPFNTEKRLNELVKSKDLWRIGVLHKELFANADDDNGSYGSSLTKKGLYPFVNSRVSINNSNSIFFNRIMKKGEEKFYKYYSQAHRIYNCPVLKIKLEEGSIKLNFNNKVILLDNKMEVECYINKGVMIESLTDSKVQFIIYDEIF